MGSATIFFLYLLLILVLTGIVLILMRWNREGGLFPGDKYEKINRELLKEIDTKLARFENKVLEAANLRRDIEKLLVSLDRTRQAQQELENLKRTAFPEADYTKIESPAPVASENIQYADRNPKVDNKTAESHTAAASNTPSGQDSLDNGAHNQRLDDKRPRELDKKSMEILKLAEEGVNPADIAQQLGIWRGEVDLVIALNRRGAK